MREDQKILDPLSYEFRAMMRNWARSRAGLLRGLGVAMSSIYDGPIRYDRSPEAGVEVLQGPAADIQYCLGYVPPRYRQAVELYWDQPGASLRSLARKTGKTGVDRYTFMVWVVRGHEILAATLSAYRDVCRRREAQTRALQART